MIFQLICFLFAGMCMCMCVEMQGASGGKVSVGKNAAVDSKLVFVEKHIFFRVSAFLQVIQPDVTTICLCHVVSDVMTHL